jgi:hypothetical protein
LIGRIAIQTNDIILKEGPWGRFRWAGEILGCSFNGIWLKNHISHDLIVAFLKFWHI